MKNWEYGEKYKSYDMNGIIEIGGGLLKVHDIYEEVPEFMKQADALFVDPPYNLSALNSYNTKANKSDCEYNFDNFIKRLFYYIETINPKTVFIEIGKRNLSTFKQECEKRFEYVEVDDSTYYHKNPCYIIRCSNLPLEFNPNKECGTILDEEDYIKYVCKNLDYECIADPCMGQGLVGYNSFLNGKRFVGTELNYKRLAVLVDKIAKDLGGI